MRPNLDNEPTFSDSVTAIVLCLLIQSVTCDMGRVTSVQAYRWQLRWFSLETPPPWHATILIIF